MMKIYSNDKKTGDTPEKKITLKFLTKDPEDDNSIEALNLKKKLTLRLTVSILVIFAVVSFSLEIAYYFYDKKQNNTQLNVSVKPLKSAEPAPVQIDEKQKKETVPPEKNTDKINENKYLTKISGLEKENKLLFLEIEILEKKENILGQKVKEINNERYRLERQTEKLKKKTSVLNTKNSVMFKQLKIMKERLMKTIKEKEKAKIIFAKELSLRETSQSKKQNTTENKVINQTKEETKILKNQLSSLRKETIKQRETMYYNLGVTYEDLGLYSEAIEEYKKALDISPDSADIHYNIAILYDDFLNNDDAALFHYQKYIEISPDKEDSAMVKGWIASIENGD